MPNPIPIIIPVLNAGDFVRKCVQGLLDTTAGDYQIVIADDGSTEEELLLFYESLAGREDVRILRNTRGTRYGFGDNCNRAVQVTVHEYFVLLNSDTVPCMGWLDPLIDELDNDPLVAVVGSRLLFPVPRWNCQAETVQHAGVARNSDGLPYHIFKGVDRDDPRVLKRREINAVTGACMALRRSAFDRFDGFSPLYPMGQFEDVHLCWTFRKHKLKVVYQPRSVLYHYEHGSGEQYVAQTSDPNRRALMKYWGRLPADEDLFK